MTLDGKESLKTMRRNRELQISDEFYTEFPTNQALEGGINIETNCKIIFNDNETV